MFFTLLIICMVIIILLYYYIERIDLLRKANVLPSPPSSYPIIGHSLIFIGDPESVFKKISNLCTQYKRLVALWLGPWLNILVFDPNDIEIIMKNSKFMEKSYHYKFLKSWLGDSILTSNGEKYRQNKKILVQSFHKDNLKNYIKIFNQQANILVENLSECLCKDEFNITNYLQIATLNTLMATSLGVCEDTISKEEALDYSKSVEKMGRLIHIRMCKLWLYPDFIYNYSQLKKEQDRKNELLNNLTKRVISKRKEEYEQYKKNKNLTSLPKKYNKFVDNFFEAIKDNGEHYTETEIKDEVMTIMFAGQDTTTVSLGFALSLLGLYKLEQDKVVDEIRQVFGDDSNRPATYEDLEKLKYLEQVIQETWRLFPPVPLIAKRPKSDVILNDNYIIPKNCTIVIMLMLLHRNPNQFPNPNRFNPDHFLPENIKKRHPYSFLPFSDNYRKCIGMKYVMLVIKVFLSTILRNYEVHSNREMREFVLAAQTTLKRKEGFLISLKKRPKL